MEQFCLKLTLLIYAYIQSYVYGHKISSVAMVTVVVM